MRPRVYVETTVISYLTAWPSRDIVRAAHQQITRDWWRERRGAFELFVSQAVIEEASAGDPEAAIDRIEAMSGLPVLDINDEVALLSRTLIAEVGIPTRAELDAVHIACATVHSMDYLLTWNCKHIANAALRVKVEKACLAAGFQPPVICTPEELEETHYG